MAKIHKILYYGIGETTPEGEIRRHIFLNIILFTSASLLLFFALYNFFINHKYENGLIDTSFFLAALWALYKMKKEHNFKSIALFVSFAFFLLFIALVYVVHAQKFTLIWILFYPVISIFTNGSKIGLRLSLLFYATVFALAWQGVGVWLDGMWDIASFSRFVAANLAMLFISYYFEKSFEATQRELEREKAKEREYIRALERSSITDPLTQLYNRRHLDAVFHEKFLKAKVSGSFFAFFILDVDKFKDYNDTYGHIAGDEALKKVADVLKESLRREADSTFRLGGEEFAGIVMANAKEKVIRSIENVRQKVEEMQIEHTKSPIDVLSVSIGVAVIDDFSQENLDTLYQAADKALYRAKKGGRNKIVVAN